ERAEISAQLHDSVLQTLSLMRARPDDPHYVRTIARGQECDLRQRLYDDRTEESDSNEASERDAATEVGDSRGNPVDAVSPGDARRGDHRAALVAAAREAMINAITHGATPVSVYVEVGAESTEVFVRDRGGGFDVNQMLPNRHGIRGSIMERMHRHGGQVSIRSGPDRGTEVHMVMPHSRNGEDRGADA